MNVKQYISDRRINSFALEQSSDDELYIHTKKHIMLQNNPLDAQLWKYVFFTNKSQNVLYQILQWSEVCRGGKNSHNSMRLADQPSADDRGQV